MKHKCFYFLCLSFVFLILSCNSSQNTVIQGHFNYAGSSKVTLQGKPVHYKYAPEIHYPIEINEDGTFSLSVETDTTEVYLFTVDDHSYPVVLQPGAELTLSISRNYFPDSVKVEGYPEPWDKAYSLYLSKTESIQSNIQSELSSFREGKSSNVLKLYEKRYHLAKKYLLNTPLDVYYYKAVGEYLVKRLEHIKFRRNQPKVNPEQERQAVIDKAKELNFFNYKSLKAQRAGIRDFTNAYANTFGVKEQLEKKYGRELVQYDVNRLGYKTLDSARTSVLRHIKNRRALAYSKMHLIAERIGEISPRIANESYHNFLNEFSDFPEYTEFLKTFYEEVEAVSPGNPAVPFSLPDQKNRLVSMDDFRGKYVLLDFWASWCIPCLDEFSHMRKLYRSYPRDQFEIVAISTEEDSLRWRQAIQRFENPWIQLYGGNGFQQETFKAYKGGGIPFYILIGPNGNILRRNDIRPSFNLPAVLDSLINDKTVL